MLIYRSCMSFASVWWLFMVTREFIPLCLAADGEAEEVEGDWIMEALSATTESKEEGEWSNYVNTLSEDYVDDYISPSSPKSRRKGEKEVKLPLLPTGVHYMAVIYRNDVGGTERYPDPVTTWIKPGLTCGGALLTKNHVLTMCGCLLTFLTRVLKKPSPFRPGESQEPNYDIHQEGAPKDLLKIYVTHSWERFSLNFKYEIDSDPTDWPTDGFLQCRAQLVSLATNRHAPGTKAPKANGEIVLLPFQPGITRSDIYPEWPPFSISRITDKFYQQIAKVMSIGEKVELSTSSFYPAVYTWVTEMGHCRMETVACNSTNLHATNRHTCFCPLGNFNESGDVIGWPIVRSGHLVGLTATLREPKHRTLFAAILHSDLTKKIEAYIGKNILEKKNEPEPIFRHGDLKAEFFVYDYYGARSRRSRSKATVTFPTVSPLFMTLFVWIYLLTSSHASHSFITV